MLSLFSILMAYFNPAHGYELSLYKSTPPIVWICLVSSIIGGVSIMYIVYRNPSYYYNYCFVGFLILYLIELSYFIFFISEVIIHGEGITSLILEF